MMDYDLISRQAAIAKLFSKLDPQDLYLPIHFKNFVLDELPSVQPKTGRWIPFDCDTWECSECKNLFTTLEGTPKDNLFNFCPNCGAKMEGE